MSRWFFVGLSALLLLCAIVGPVIWINLVLQFDRSAFIPQTSQALNQAMLIAILLGVPGIILIILMIADKLPSASGWSFLLLGLLLLVYAFITPNLWMQLSNKLTSGGLDSIGSVLFTLFTTAILGSLSITLIILGILKILRGQ
jgi:hypothetical protein